jgi:hypothetical protein
MSPPEEIVRSKQEIPVSSADLESELPGSDLLDDCRMMLRFAVKEGLEPDQSLRHDIAALDNLLLKVGLETISEVPADLVASRSKAPMSSTSF